MSADRTGLTDNDLTLLLLENVRLVHKRDTCDPAGRSLRIYTCEYHQGYEEGLDRMADVIQKRTVAEHDEWVRRNFLGSGSSIVTGPHDTQTWNAPR